jgi:serine phosphatase RsbU (regulator of sigma subunit)
VSATDLSLLQNQHNEITDSIAYAQRIQQAVLPFTDRFNATFGAENYFILYKPRNVVSGDFYWLYENDKVENQPIILVVADCTGHGVPGAFMSMIGIQLLQEIVIQQNTILPDEILTKLKSEIIYVLKQKQSKTNDGMDAVAISINKPNKKVLFAGAMNPLFYIQDDKLIEIKGDKISIGGMYSDEGKIYSSTTILCETTTTFYLVSDGYRDQFGGKANKKFTSKQMKELFMTNHQQKMSVQKNILETAINEWITIANETQTDDITVMGIKI